MRYRVLLSLAALIASIAGSQAASAAILTLNPPNSGGTSWVFAAAHDSATEIDSLRTYSYPTSLPDFGALSDVDGASTTTTTFSLANDTFEFVFDNLRGTNHWAYASSQGEIYFSPSADVGYSFTGTYTSNDPDGRKTALLASLYDFTTSTFLYSSLQMSEATAAETFTLGQTGGDFHNELIGSPTGTLVSGHQYQLVAGGAVSAHGTGAPSPAHGTGYVTVTFVPEPSVGLLLLMGIVALAGVTRRSRSLLAVAPAG